MTPLWFIVLLVFTSPYWLPLLMLLFVVLEVVIVDLKRWWVSRR